MMQQFNTLSKQEQQNQLLKEGIFLAEREDGPFRVMLYQLDNFYVEVYFFNLYNKVAFLQTFSDTDTLGALPAANGCQQHAERRFQ